MYPAGVALTPDGTHLYLTDYNNDGPGDVSAYTVATDGSLTALPGSPVAAGIGPAGIARQP